MRIALLLRFAARLLRGTVLLADAPVRHRSAAGRGRGVGAAIPLMGAASNAVAAGFLARIRPWTFVEWVIYGLPCFLLIFPLTWWVLMRMAPVTVRRLDVEPARAELEKMGPMDSAGREILGTMAAAALFWISGPGR